MRMMCVTDASWVTFDEARDVQDQVVPSFHADEQQEEEAELEGDGEEEEESSGRKRSESDMVQQKTRDEIAKEQEQSPTWCNRRHVMRSPRNKSRVRHGATEDT